MKNLYKASSAAALLAFSGCLLATQPAWADAETECRDEATYYNVEEDQLQDYIDNCVASRGGLGSEPSANEDMMPSSDSEMQQSDVKSE